MNRRLITSASKSAATSARSRHAGASSTALRFLTARHFSDTASAEDDDVDIKVGTIKFFRPQGFGIILPDGVHKRNHEQKDLYFIHTNDIKSAEYNESGKRIYLTGVERGTRVRFRAGPPDEGKESGRAYDLTLENGDWIPPFQPDYMEKYARRQKCNFGEEVYGIFNSCKDQIELETKVVASFDQAKNNIETMRLKVEKALELTRLKKEGEEQQ